MKAELFVVEKTDTAGRFQPLTDCVHKHRVEAIDECERFVKAHDGVSRFRVAVYERKEIR